MEEIEIKFAVKETEPVTGKLKKLGFRIAVGRHREENYLFDDASGNLQKSGRLLRVRKTPSSKTVTFKGPISPTSKLKHREEIECRIEDAETMIRILEEAGFKTELNIPNSEPFSRKTASTFRWTKRKPVTISKWKARRRKRLSASEKNWDIRKRILSVERMQS